MRIYVYMMPLLASRTTTLGGSPRSKVIGKEKLRRRGERRDGGWREQGEEGWRMEDGEVKEKIGEDGDGGMEGWRHGPLPRPSFPHVPGGREGRGRESGKGKREEERKKERGAEKERERETIIYIYIYIYLHI